MISEFGNREWSQYKKLNAVSFVAKENRVTACLSTFCLPSSGTKSQEKVGLIERERCIVVSQGLPGFVLGTPCIPNSIYMMEKSDSSDVLARSATVS